MTMRCILLFILLLAALTSPNAWATPTDSTTTGTLAGHVADAATGEPLFYCNIVIDSLSIGTITDMHGNFILRGILPGRYRLVVSRIGHASYIETDFTIAAGEHLSRDIRMETAVLRADPVVVTATRKAQTAQMAPASVFTVDSEQIDDQQVPTFDQVLENVPGMEVIRSMGISTQSVSIRGASDTAGGGIGNRVLLLVDGRPALTSDSGGAFWNLVPLALVDHVEVVKGAYSSLYGSTAMGGVVNVITKRPEAHRVTQLDTRVGYFENAPADIRYTDEAQLQSEITLSTSGKHNRTGYLVQGSFKQSDGYVEHSKYEFFDVYTKLLFDLQSNRDLEVTVGGGTAQNDYPHSWLNSAQPLRKREKFKDDRQEKRHFNADVLYRALAGNAMKYSSRFYWFHHEQESFFNEDDPDLTIPGNEPLGTTTNVDGNKVGNITQLDVYFGDRADLVAGADLQIDDVASAPDSIMYGDHQVNNFALFAQSDVKLHRTVTATIGARYDWNHLVGGKTIEEFSPKLAMVWAPTTSLSLRGLYGQAFRAPTIAELYFQREIAGGTDFVPNPDLTAERMTLSAEVGVRWSPSALLTLDVAGYRYDYENMIYWDQVSDEYGVSYPLFQVRNLNSALIQGVDISARTMWRNTLGLSAGYTYLDTQDRSPGANGRPLPYRPNDSIRLGADVFWQKATLHTDARYRSGIEEVFLFPLQKPDAFWVANAGVRYLLLENVTVSVKLNNVFNAQYEELARYRMPGRNWLVGLNFRL